MAVSSLVIMSACCVLIRSVDDQLNPNRKGGMPVRGHELFQNLPHRHLAVQHLVVRSDHLDVHVAHGDKIAPPGPSRPASMAADHSRAIWRLRSWAMDCSRGASPGL